MTHKHTPILTFLITLLLSSPVYAGLSEAWQSAGRKTSSFLTSAGEVAVGGGVVIIAVVGLILAIVIVFTLLMMIRR